MKEHEHKYVFQGIVYSDGNQRPGSGAYDRVYEDMYYCESCLDIEYRNRRISGNTYEHPLEGTYPK